MKYTLVTFEGSKQVWLSRNGVTVTGDRCESKKFNSQEEAERYRINNCLNKFMVTLLIGVS